MKIIVLLQCLLYQCIQHSLATNVRCSWGSWLPWDCTCCGNYLERTVYRVRAKCCENTAECALLRDIAIKISNESEYINNGICSHNCMKEHTYYNAHICLSSKINLNEVELPNRSESCQRGTCIGTLRTSSPRPPSTTTISTPSKVTIGTLKTKSQLSSLHPSTSTTTAVYNFTSTSVTTTATATTYRTTTPWWWRTTTRTTHWWTHYSTRSVYFQNAINVDCNEYTWNIVVDMNRLRQVFPNAKSTDIYLGENKCTGIEKNDHLTFQQGLDDCLTSGRLQNGRNIYNNELIYAEHDPVYTFIIRHYNWTVDVECDVNHDGNGYGYVNSGTSSLSPSLSSPQYPVNISYYLDPNYMKEISANPLHVTVGAEVYVKVFTETYDWNARMRVVSCYTKPTFNAPDHTKYYLLKNGCEVDTNTHIISQSSHETKFLFDNFEYTNNHEGIYLFCDTIFCNSHDYSARCRQSCNPVIRRKVALEKVQSDDTETTQSTNKGDDS